MTATTATMSAFRKIDTHDFRRATRHTARAVNRQIVLSLIRERQPISRADLARHMSVARSQLTHLIGGLLADGAVVEGATATQSSRGRPPTMLWLRTPLKALAVDVRRGETTVALADFRGHVSARDRFPTPSSPGALVRALAKSATRVAASVRRSELAGVGVVVPGMVDQRQGRVVFAPRLGWRDVALRDALTAVLRMPVHVAATPVAGALAHLWLAPESERARSFAYVSVSDDVGVGVVMGGEPLCGEFHAGGEVGHLPLDTAGPECACGRRGCWEAFACDEATVTRYTHRVLGTSAGRRGRLAAGAMTITDVVRRARDGDAHAVAALAETGHCIGSGLATIVSAFGPGRVVVGGEIVAAWDLIERPLRSALADRALTPAAGAIPVVPDPRPDDYRLLGAVALVLAPAFAAPRLA